MRNVTMREFLFAVIQFFTGFLDDGVDAALEVAVGNAHHMVGGYAVFGALAVAVVDGAGREPHAPSARQLAAEGHAASATGVVAHGDDAWTAAHVLDKLVGGTEDGAVGEHSHRLVPAYAAARAQPLLLHGREVVVAAARLVLHISHEDVFVGKAGSQLFGGAYHSTGVAAYVDDEGAAGEQIGHDVVEVAFAETVGKGGAAHIAYVVVEDAVADARRDAVVGAEIASGECVGEVGGIVFAPTPVAADVEGGVEIDVAVAQFAEHVAEHFKLLVLAHVAVYLARVALVDLVPVYALLTEETVVLVHDAPQGFKVAARRVGVFVFIYAAGHADGDKACQA